MLLKVDHIIAGEGNLSTNINHTLPRFITYWVNPAALNNEIIHLTVDSSFENPLVKERKESSNSFSLFPRFVSGEFISYTAPTKFSTYLTPVIEHDITIMVQCFLI